MPTFEARVAAGGDDGTWQNSNANSFVIHGAGTGVHGSGFGAGDGFNVSMHYNGVTIPRGSTINVAFLRFKARNADSANVVRTNVYGIDEDNPTAPVTKGDAVGKALTAPAAWDNLPTWSVNEEGADTTTVSIVAQVQTIVDRGGWASGQAMEFQVKDDGTTLSNIFRRSYTFNTGGGPQSCLVHIEYTDPPPPGGPLEEHQPGSATWAQSRRTVALPY